MDSIEYYNKNANSFYNRTINANLQEIYHQFLQCVPKNGRILDAGCGSGRDSKFFLSQGYEVVAIDGSTEMVKMASTLLGKNVSQMLFQDIHFCNEFDAIWANASLLHVPYECLRETIRIFHKSLRPNGIFYASFKYGASMRQSEDRIFFDMDETKIEPYLSGLFEPLKIWKNADTRSTVAPSPDKCWLNCIAKCI